MKATRGRRRGDGDGDGDCTISGVANKRLAHPEARGRRAPWRPPATRADAPCKGRAATAGTAGPCARADGVNILYKLLYI